MKISLYAAAFLAFGVIAFPHRASADPTGTYNTLTGDLSDISGWSLVGEVRSGSNGNENLPDPDFDLIDPSYNGDGGYILWDDDPTLGFTSGTNIASLTVDLNAGTATLNVTDADYNVHTANYSGISGSISDVIIRAAVQAAGESGWSSVDVSFYKSGTLRETYSDTGPSIDTTSTSYTTAEQTLTVTPSDTDDDKVVISGTFNFSTSATAPGPDDLFDQIFVFTH